MKKLDCLKVLLFLSIFSSANAAIRITEIMPCNTATIVSDKYNYDGYVEFFNDGGNVDLKGWTVTNYKGENVDWTAKLDSTHIVPNGYSLLFFGKSETGSVSAIKVQQNYVGRVGHKLSTDEGSIVLEKDNQKISISYPDQRPHLSYCEDGFMSPTPGKQNDKFATSISNRVATPTFKPTAPGFYEGEVAIQLACETEGATIYYTLNGDIPTPQKGKIYKHSINVDTTTVVRARAYKDGMLYSDILTGSYIFTDSNYDACETLGERLPIVSITADSLDVYGAMLGFYVEGTNGKYGGCTPVANYNQDWLRAANFEYILNGKVVNNQEVEVGVYGGCTRVHVARSLKIKANKRSGKNKMYYNSFFPSRSYTKYKSLALRNGGNGYSYVQPRWRDMFIQSLGDGMNLDKQVSQPVAYYLNGKFYGMMILTERTDEDYVYHNYGIDEDDIDLLHVSVGYLADKGSLTAYNKMIDYVSKNYDKKDFYDVLNTHMDVDNYVDYQIIEQYVGNTDWVTNNTKMWRKRDGGRFRWILYDTDFGLSKATKLDTCMLDFTTTLMKNNALERSIILMKSCMQNEDFRWKFLDQYLDRLENQFTDERIDTKLDSIWSLTARDMCATIKISGFLGCPGSLPIHDEEVEKMRVFAKERKGYVVNQLKKAYGLGDDSVLVKIRTIFPDGEEPEFSFLLNKREFTSSKFNTWRFVNSRVKVEPIVPYGYRIQKWAINNITVRNNDGTRYSDKELTAIADSTELKFTITFEHDPHISLPTDLHLNEICASNKSTLDENGEASDWIEIYNGSDSNVDLAGMAIENEAKNLKCIIPSGYSETKVPAHGYKLLWADKNPEMGPLHLNFKLGVSAPEKIVLSRYYLGADVELSSITTTPHNSDESYGRVTDGASAFKVFGICTDKEGNTYTTSTPLDANGSIECTISESEQITADQIGLVYSQGKKIHVNQAKGSDVRVYSMLGDMVANKTANTNSLTISVPTTGVYIVKVGTKGWKVVVK